jgi:hypothetical protein
LLIDPPARWQSVEDVLADQSRTAFSSPNAMTWFPNLETRTVQPECRQLASALGAVAAALVAETRSSVDMLDEKPVLLRGADARLEINTIPADTQRLRRAGVNTLRQISALHLELDGNVTLARNESLAADRQNLDSRILIMFILRRIREATQWTFFHESSPELWQELSAQIGVFLAELHGRSMLAGQHGAQAYYVKCDRDTNREYIGKTGEVAFIVGFALDRPGEFLAFRFQRTRGGCRIVELGWDAGLERAS